MRLLHTTTLAFHDFFADDTPPYAILSHRWGEEEISYQHYLDQAHAGSLGHQKVIEACKLAASRNRDYIWIDTVCIDKRSSAELSEAINSMFNWYKGAIECYAYLPDVSFANGIESLAMSDWFTRGWTLQELLAPQVMLFFDGGWQSMGSKSDLAAIISRITGIAAEILHHPLRLFKVSWPYLVRRIIR